jgi:endo-1,4-beta-D-glucanase Y/4-amino-4-deoxy-L-arabinose transferase-like glycosyltransferase
MKKLVSYLKSHSELFWVITLLLIAAFAFSYNMYHYPYYEDDEGTYMSQAWSVLTQGKLAPYTYWYDHAPMGWLLIAVWEVLTGGFFTFGFSVNSGRVLMMVLHVVSAYFLYMIAKKISGSKLAASISVLVFALSPLGLSFERRVLLDNIMTFWLLISYYLILGNGKRLSHYMLSAILFGISVLSKETAIFFLPVLLFTVYKTAHTSHRIFAVWKWLSIVFCVISLYFLYALIKGEFFPSGTLLGGTAPHVSIVDAFHYQLSRTGGFFLTPKSAFMLNFMEWIKGGFFIPVPDPTIIIGGIVATAIMSFWSLKDKRLLFVSLPCLSYWLFLIRGGEIIGFYIIPLIPFLALCIGMSVYVLSEFISRWFLRSVTKPLSVLLLLSPFIWYYATHPAVYQLDQTTPQIKALDWIAKNIPKKANIVMDNYAYIEFHDHNPANKYNLPTLANYYWKADKDPDVSNKVLQGNWRTVDYILATPQVQYDADNAGLPLIKNAFDNSVAIQTFQGHKWNVEIRKVIKGQNMVLSDMWSMYKQTFISPDGEVTDPSTGKTTSEGQSYALLHAVWLNDKNSFDTILHWTIKNTLLDDKNLFAWWYGKNNKGTIGIVDKGTATDADQDIAVALLLASRQWHDQYYLSLAQKIIPDIWQYETAEVAGKRYVVAGNWTSQKDQDVYTINPSYLSPYAYRLFAQVDQKHDWASLVSSSYEILDKCSSSSLGVINSMYLPPNWCNVRRDGQVVAANNITKDSTNYSFDALRVVWRIALDYQWNKDSQALAYLKKISLFTNEWNKKHKIFATYAHDGKNLGKDESLIQYSTQLAYFNVTDPKIANSIFITKINPERHEYQSLIYWGDKNNYYTQNWIWFGIALYSGNIPNLW